MTEKVTLAAQPATGVPSRAMPATPDPVAFAGTERFEIRRRLGAGAMGVVYEAFDRERDMVVALKAMRSAAPETLYRLKQELRALAGIAHPNLVAIHELHCEGALWFLTMELLPGAVDLVSYVRAGGFDEARARAALAQLAQGVAALHAAGRLHRDIKPSNVLVTAEPRVVLIDFGISGVIGDGLRAGTAAYVAPEQAAGDASEASDWYAVGVVMFELLCGARPFQGSSRAIVFDKSRYDAPAVASLAPAAPADLAALCDALLRRDPSARPAASEVLRRLDVAPRARVVVREPDELVGRADALAVLDDAFAATERGSGRVVHLRGSSGIGKTTLLRVFLERAARTGAVVLAARCYPQESVPYKAVDGLVDALARFLGALPASEADAMLPRDAALLARMFPVLSDVAAIARAPRRGPLPEPHELRRRSFAALRELCARIAERRVLVLAIDDVQWGDLDSAPILEGLLAPPDPPPLLLVLAYRAEDEARAPLVAALRTRRERLGESLPTTDLVLERLLDDDTRALAARLVDDAPRAAAIARESGGVPFLVHELARRAAPSIEEAIAGRLAELPAERRVVLELIAHAAQPIARAVLVIASGSSPVMLERQLATLVAGHLVRVTPGEGEPRFECYHDRIREAVGAALVPARRRELHGRLADALAAARSDELEALVVHLEGAGQTVRAGEHALAAAEQARAALAFDRAAYLYRAALRLAELDAVATRDVRTALGDALANAGQGGDAAEAYLAAAADAPAADAVELRRRAASQYLRTGRIESGLRILDSVLAEVGGRLPRSPRRALASLGWQRTKLRLRGLGFRRRDATRISPYELARLDVLWTAATDLGMVDLIVGLDFGTRQLALALSLGEPTRVARALTAEAMFLASQGRRTQRRTELVLARAQALVGELDDPELPAWLSASRGMAEYQLGRFRSAAEHGETCVRRLREDCTGVLWQVGGVEVQVMWSLFYLGELRALTERVDAAVAQARLRGNRFDAANFGTGLPALAWAVADRTAQGRLEVHDAMAEWSPRGFHLQHYYALLALASFELYDGEAVAARARFDALWPLLRGSHLLVCPSVAIEAYHLRARIAIANGDADPAASRELARLAGNPWADAMHALVEAGAAPQRDDAIRLLAIAIEACVQADLAAFAAAARRRRGELVGGPEGAAAIERADRELAERSVRAPVAFARMLVPIRAEAPP